MARFAIALLALTTGACALAPPEADGLRWQSRKDGSPAGVADTGDCRAQAERQASMRYLPRVMEVTSGSGGRTSVTLPNDDPGRLAAENRFYSQCMQQKGFQLVIVPS